MCDKFCHWDDHDINILRRLFNNDKYCAGYTSENKFHTIFYFTTEKIVITYNYLYGMFIVWNTLYHKDNHNGNTITLSVNEEGKKLIRENKNGSHKDEIICVQKALKGSQYKTEIIFIVGKNALFDFLYHYDSYFLNELTNKNQHEIIEKSREYTLSSKAKRDPRFRNMVLAKYNYTCIVCGCREKDVLQAAHIISVENGGNDSVENGYCLCANHHLLFDSGKLSIDLKTKSFCCNDTSDIYSCWYKESKKRNFKLYLQE